jgi:hypothetical protein
MAHFTYVLRLCISAQTPSSVSTQQTHVAMLEIKNSFSTVDTRWSFFQSPLVVEDALGFKFPVPSEYDYELLDTIIKHRFQDGPGCLEVNAGNYEIFKSKERNQIISVGVRLLPGTAITMAVLVAKPPSQLLDEVCPMRKCGSKHSSIAVGGGRIW